jgi:hypothetical protein
MATFAGGIEPEFRKPKGVALLRNEYFNLNSLPCETPPRIILNRFSATPPYLARGWANR